MLVVVFTHSTTSITLLIWNENRMNAYKTIVPYTVTFTIPDDATTQVTISTKSQGVCFASSLEEALEQTQANNDYSHQTYASYILGYIADNLIMVDVEDTAVTYTDEPTITSITQDELEDFQREVISRNG
jgi:hypothetical protein